MERKYKAAAYRIIDQYRDDVDELAVDWENSYCNRFCPFANGKCDLHYHEISKDVCREKIWNKYLEDVNG